MARHEDEAQDAGSPPPQRTVGRREALQTLAIGTALLPLGCGETSTGGAQDTAGAASADAATDGGSDASTDTQEPVPCDPVGGGAQIDLGPLSGGVTSTSVRLAVRLDKAGLVQFSLLPAGGGAPIASPCGLAAEAADFAVVLDVAGLQPDTAYTATPLIDGVAVPAAAIATRTYPTPGQARDFSFCFGSCQRHDFDGGSENGGQAYEVVAALSEKPLFFAQIGDWTYPDYAFAKNGLDAAGNNYTVYPDELRKSWHRRLDPKYPMRKVLRQVPVAHVWDDHDFAQNNGHRDVTGKQADRVGAFERYLPCYPLPQSKLGVWQHFSAGQVDFWLVDMRSQRTDQAKTVVKSTNPDGSVKLSFVEPPDHTLLGPEQLAWLLDGLRASQAVWKVVFLPVEVNPNYDLILQKGLELKLPIVVEAAADGWCGYPTERQKLLDLHQKGEVKNLLFLTGDAHQAAMKARDAVCPPVFMAANLDIGQAPVIDLLASFDLPGAKIWPHWTQDGSGTGTVGRVRFVTAPKHQAICEAIGIDGQVLATMVVDAEV